MVPPFGKVRLVHGHATILGIPKLPSTRFGCAAAPLFEEEVNSFPFTLVLYVKNPLFLHTARVRAAFATHDDPRYAVKVEDTNRADEGFDRKKTNRNRCDFKVCDSPRCQAIFDGHTEPYVFRGDSLRVSAYEIIPHQGTALCKHLEDMPVGSLDDVEYLVDETSWDLFVKEIAHGVYKHFPRASP